MRLLKRESIEIANLVEKYFSKDQYKLVKKKGWVHIVVNDRSFAFHRNDIATIVRGKLEHSFGYRIRTDDTETPIDDLAGVLNALAKWLKTRYPP